MSKLLAVRIPESLIAELKNIRKRDGTVISHFVAEAISEKMREMKETEEDKVLITSRINEPAISEKEWTKHLKKKGVRA